MQDSTEAEEEVGSETDTWLPETKGQYNSKEKELSPNKNRAMTLPNRKIKRFLKVGVVLVCIFTIILIVIASLASASGKKFAEIVSFHISGVQSVGDVTFDESSNMFNFKSVSEAEIYLTISTLNKLKSKSDEEDKKSDYQCSKNVSSSLYDHDEKLHYNGASQLCLKFEDDVDLMIKYAIVDGLRCHSFSWMSNKKTSSITSCLDIGEVNWYGGGGISVHKWPLNRADVPLQPFLTRKFDPNDKFAGTHFDSFIEPYFLSADGVAVIVEDHLPLFVAVQGKGSDKKICFKTELQPPYKSEDLNVNVLKFQVCKDQSAKSVHKQLLKSEKISHPYELPDEDVIRKPLWSTRGRNVENIKQSDVLNFVTNIFNHKLPFSELLIDGNYSKGYGNFFFDEKKFSHSHQIIMEFQNDPSHDKLPVGIEIFPHVPVEQSEKYAIKYRTQTQSSVAAKSPLLLDFSNEEAIVWYKGQLKEIMNQISVKAFRFSGGYAYDLYKAIESCGLEMKSPSFYLNDFTTSYSEIASEFGSRSLVGSGYKSQQETIIADAGPMMSTWHHERKGLKSIIPTVITYGLLGYPFVLAGPVGGVSLSRNKISGQFDQPEQELFIRWLQLAIYLPVIEFSTGPWEYHGDERVMNYTKKVLELRRDVLWEKHFKAAVKEATAKGTPIIRPLWWIAPMDKVAQFIDCEFLLGSNLLVAPVLYHQARSRDIYLPLGSWWHDDLRNTVHRGGRWLSRYQVGLYEIATFTRRSGPEASDFS